MYEKRHEPILSRAAFAARLAQHAAVAGAVIAASLGIGTLGYRAFAGLDWIDALLNASMILAGMGPVSSLPDAAAKLFASAYALFSGIVFIAVMGILLAPLLHRLIHKFHLEEGRGR
jgi:hypothetical protein